jgi:SAM-dependent methyltransferase
MNSDTNLRSHWNKTYEKTEVEKLGWYEDIPEQSLQLIEKCNLDKKARILNAGSGASTLIDTLLQLGYNNIIANDISENALNKLKTRLGEAGSSKVEFIVDDLLNPSNLSRIEKVDLWHDRAVLHFFTDIADQNAYFNLLNNLVKPKGFAIIATFNLNGATKCSGLDVYRYDKAMIAEKIGNSFKLIDSFDYTYTMPSGNTREYVYTLFQRIN